ncbi:efflux RND transporter periplasmic adaptor subunit [Paraliomyxa miuraensis]|uniref:efflux RND transporter periplasmic adaptor subunit n=1 Tax=Paraliomyxa miuraensis TaxID=376150 RepID=UPI002252C01A|nr:efflux RND transporter periplasmic adaptor subunit [Paraliomyxa miuraensis]MCX4240934.1 efflux RND transporter periplasmic adaptor subunit [Paraliomyxa miuraensis]
MPRLRRAILPLVFVIAGAAIAGWLVHSKPEARPQAPDDPITFVEVEIAQPTTHAVTVAVMGVVRAEREVTLQPEVSGRVVEHAKALVDGGLVKAGDPLVRLDARDYASAVEISKADLAQARLAVREEEVQRTVAQAEWRDAPPDFSEQSRAYVMREPHLDAAQARVSSARTRIERAKRDVGKTLIRAPFDAVVLAESVELGQLIGPQTPVARLAGIDRFWIQASIPVSQLPFLEIPGVNTDQAQGSPATVIDHAAGELTREGFVLRLLPAVEERGRMAQIVIAVDDPLGLRVPPGERPTPLLVGTYVEAELRGRTLEGVVAVPRRAMIDDAHLWVVDAEQRLRSREVTVAWRERGRVFVKAGLRVGDRFVISNLPVATEGMRVQQTEPAPSPTPTPTPVGPS